MAQQKILVAGDVLGNFGTLFSRINSIIKKNGNFDMLICVGEFFNGEASLEAFKPYKEGKEKVPLQTYILGPSAKGNCCYYEDMHGCELCPNLTYLGKHGVFTGSSGLQIAYISGKEVFSDGVNDTVFTEQSIGSFILPLSADSKFKGIDILLTSQWPKGVEKYAGPATGFSSLQEGSLLVAKAAVTLKPRYHFAAHASCHYERLPYRNHKVLSEGSKHVSRFISLAKVGNIEKKKFLYAFNIVPLKHLDNIELNKQPDDVTECPYSLDISIKSSVTETTGTQFFFNTDSDNRKRYGGKNEDRSTKKPRVQPTGPCWFCLGSPDVEKHLVVSVGNSTYLALAKGGLVPDHILILPIGHYQSTVSCPDDVIEEIDKYKKALVACFRAENKAAVFFERNFKTQHLQIQVVPVPLSAAGEVKDVFVDSAQHHQKPFELHEIPKMSDLRQIMPAGAPYFYVELPSGEKLLHRVKKFFPLQFGREVLAGPELLDITERIDWKDCKVDKDSETSMAKDFRKTFLKYDFNIS